MPGGGLELRDGGDDLLRQEVELAGLADAEQRAKLRLVEMVARYYRGNEI